MEEIDEVDEREHQEQLSDDDMDEERVAPRPEMA